MPFDRFGRQRVEPEPIRAESPVAIHAHARKPHDERVAGFGAFDIERPRQRIRPHATNGASVVVAARIDRFRDHGLARADARERLVCAGERVVVNLGDDRLRLGERDFRTAAHITVSATARTRRTTCILMARSSETRFTLPAVESAAHRTGSGRPARSLRQRARARGAPTSSRGYRTRWAGLADRCPCADTGSGRRSL